MASSQARTVGAYLKELPKERREVIAAVRRVILKHLPKGYEESMNWGMIAYEIPLARYPNTYNGQPLGYVALGSQKNAISLYLMNVYGDPKILAWFQTEWAKTGKRLNMGKSCIRFKTLEDLPLDLIGKTIEKVSVEKYLERYEETHRNRLPHQKKKLVSGSVRRKAR